MPARAAVDGRLLEEAIALQPGSTIELDLVSGGVLTMANCADSMSCNDYVSVSELHGAALLAGASTTFAVPRLDPDGPRYIQGLYGFSGPRNGAPATVDMPNTLRIFDAHTGAFLSEQAVAHSGETFPVEVIDEAALARLGPTQDSLTPTFFRGTASIPKDLEPAAESYRSDFRRALHSRHLEFYTSQAGPWMTWVGLVP